MNAIELFHLDGKSSGVFYCSQCRAVKITKDDADRCCEPDKCRYCGKETGRKHYLACGACEQERATKAEAERFAKAKKVTKWDSYVYSDGTGNDGYSESVSEFLEGWENDHADGDERPQYVWACSKNHFAVADISDITERITGDAYEGFEEDDLNGLDELKAAIDKFNEANKGVCGYEPDYTTAVLLNADAFGEVEA